MKGFQAINANIYGRNIIFISNIISVFTRININNYI